MPTAPARILTLMQRLSRHESSAAECRELLHWLEEHYLQPGIPPGPQKFIAAMIEAALKVRIVHLEHHPECS